MKRTALQLTHLPFVGVFRVWIRFPSRRDKGVNHGVCKPIPAILLDFCPLYWTLLRTFPKFWGAPHYWSLPKVPVVLDTEQQQTWKTNESQGHKQPHLYGQTYLFDALHTLDVIAASHIRYVALNCHLFFPFKAHAEDLQWEKGRIGKQQDDP